MKGAVKDLRLLQRQPGNGLLHLHAPKASREPKTTAVEEPKATAPAGSGQAPIAQQDSTGSQNEAAMFDLVLRSNRDELRQQLQSIIGNADATATFKKGSQPCRRI